MIEEGNWEEQGGAGAYLWLAIYIAMAIIGLYLGI